jgi:beta-lactamase class D
MIERVVVAFMALLFVSPTAVAAATWQERPDWARFFQHAGVGGTIVIVDQRAGADTHFVHGADDLPKREGIAREVLKSIGALPEN